MVVIDCFILFAITYSFFTILFFGGAPARSCEGRTVPSMPLLPWPTLFLLNFRCVLIFENCAKFGLHFLKTSMLCKKHSEQGRRIFFASRSPHCVRDDNSLYARNDKNQDGCVVFKKTPHHDNFLCLGRGNVGRLLRLAAARGSYAPRG